MSKNLYKNNLFDKINLRSSHKSIATRSGGLSLFCVLIIVSIFFISMVVYCMITQF